MRPGVSSSLLTVAALAGIVVSAAAVLRAEEAQPQGRAVAATPDWIAPGADVTIPAYSEAGNAFGLVGLLNAEGPVSTKGHPFFEPIGSNGRSCATCHQPSDGMSLSLTTIKQRWAQTGGKDPLFAAVDGRNCPSLPVSDPASHSLLLERGLFRIPLPWPPRDREGAVIEPEFDIEVVRDSTGCNLHPVYGLHSAQPTISVYRRPRPLANTKYTTHQNMNGPFILPFTQKNATATGRDETGALTSMNLMADARYLSLREQAAGAALNHLERTRLTEAQLDRIVAFERQVYAAQSYQVDAGSLTEPDGPPAFGPANLKRGKAGLLGNSTRNYVFPMGEAWKAPSPSLTAARNEARASIRRGHDVFFYRTFWIKDSMHVNTVGLGNPLKRTCATCHNMHMMGMDVANGWVDLGTTNLPWAVENRHDPWVEKKAELPLFKVTCKANVPPHPFYGRVIYTQDPGRALISGKCNDVGAIIMQQMRALSARAPYFVNGSAQTLMDVVTFYDRRYNIGFTEQERRDLVAFMSSL